MSVEIWKRFPTSVFRSSKATSIHEMARYFFYTYLVNLPAAEVEGSKINLLLPWLFACLKLVNFKDEKWWWVGNSSWKSVNLAKRRKTATEPLTTDATRARRDVFQPKQFCSFAGVNSYLRTLKIHYGCQHYDVALARATSRHKDQRQ